MTQSPGAIDLSVIVPTLNEAENLAALAERVQAALSGLAGRYEIIIVDDNSQDDTRAVCAGLARSYPLRLIVREHPKGGLSGAVLEGIAASSGGTIVVMDADLQHPPEQIPSLLGQLEQGADFVIGSRYVPGASTEEQWGAFRRLNSWIATALARPFAGRTHDPMSGFFALRRSTYESAERLTPLGYKIALELMCKARVRSVREVPIHFGTRQRGQSKLTLKQQFRYLEHLSRLYDYTFPRASPIVKFGIATLLAWLVGGAGYAALVGAGMSMPPAAACSYPLAIAMVAAFHLRYVRTQREFLVTRRPWGDFAMISLAEWIICALVASWAAMRLDGPSAWEVFFLSFGCAAAMRYALRKELLLDVRGLRRDPRGDELRRRND